MRVALYARVACQDQLSLDCQVAHLIDHARSRGYEIEEIIADNGVSGFENQKSIDALIKLSRDGKIDTILCHNLTRICRCFDTRVNIEREFRKYGVRIETLAYCKRDNYEDSLLEMIEKLHTTLAMS